MAGRKNKFNEIEPVICGELKQSINLSTYSPPIINEWKSKLISLDPKLAESEMPINQALITILEKCIFLKLISPL